jgi:ATP-dependent Clp protease ATP-binding subunit ClpC
MDSQFSQKIKDVLSYSKEEAIRLGNSYIRPEHFFLGILRDGESIAVDILSELIDLQEIKLFVEEAIREPIDTNREIEHIPLLKSSERILKLVYLEARALRDEEISTGHLLLAVLRDENNLVSRYLMQNNIDYEDIRNALEIRQPRNSSSDYGDEDDERSSPFGGMGKGSQGSSQSKSSSDTPVLDNFGIDLTKAAEEGRLDPIVGREKEIERIAQILSRRKKNNPILIGEPGVGKSAIVEGLALRIVQRKVSRVLFDKRVIALDLASIVAGTKYRGQFEERMKAILNELQRNPDVILFIDEIHTIIRRWGNRIARCCQYAQTCLSTR